MKALWFSFVILALVHGPGSADGETQADTSNMHPRLIPWKTQKNVNKHLPDRRSFDCPSNFACPGDGFFGDPCDCTKYHQCHAGNDYAYSCPPGTLWSQQMQNCDGETNVMCKVQPSVTTEVLAKSSLAEIRSPQKKASLTLKCTNNTNFVRVCYYSNWAYWRSGNGKYTVADIDLDVCTHLVYAFAVLNAKTHKIKAQDSWLDLPSGLDNYNAFTSLKNQKPGLKTSLAIGGATDSQGSYKYSDLVASPSLRKAFIQHVIPFLQQYNFDGLDLDWEFPASSGGGRPKDKANFACFVRELKTAFEPHGLILTAAVGASEQIAKKSYDIPTLSQYLDYIHLMTYDFHGSWDANADHHSKLYNDPANFDSDYTVSYWISKGAPPEKLVLGIPIYGQSFTLSSRVKRPPAPASGPGKAGSITKEAGLLSYLEICINVKNWWTVVVDNTGQMGPYAYSGNQWVGYDDVDMVRIKAQYIMTRGLGGSMVWAIDLEDFKNTCGQGRYPLLNAIADTLRNGSCRSTGKRSLPFTNGLTKTSITPCNVEFTCPGDGSWADPCNCQKYYQCFGGSPTHKSCPDGALWFQHLLSCDWADESLCFMTSAVPTCDGRAVYRCSSDRRTIHMICSDGSKASFECPEELVWSADLLECVSSLNAKAGC